MSTKYEEIYDRFLNKVTDYDLVALTTDDLEVLLLKYLKSAITGFKYCLKDLKDRDDLSLLFNINLDENEQEILAKLMLIEWINPQINSQENIKQVLGSRDYSIYSPANLLDKLIVLKKSLQSDVQDELTFYYYAT